jgi:hypothetical protein
MNKYNSERHEYQMDGQIVPGVTKIINHFFPIYSGIKDLEWYSLRGQTCHKTIELYDRGVLDPTSVNAVIMPYLKQWKACKKALKIEVLENESILFSKRFRFGGIRDKLVIVNDKLTLLDLKLVSVVDKVKAAYQTAGYTILHNEGVKFKDKIKKRLVIQLKENTYKLFWFDNKQDEPEFLSLLSVFNILQREGKIK